MIIPGWTAAAALLVDWVIGDPKRLPHPVSGMGRLIAFGTRHLNHGPEHARRRKGVLLAVTVPAAVWLVSAGILYAAWLLHPFAAIAAGTFMTASTIACRGLKEAADAVAVPLFKGDLPAARRSLSMIVGRDTERLNEAEIVRGTVETVAENTVDGVTAPLFYAFIGGPPLAMAYRAVNTLDSLVGYRSEEYAAFGWASARLDDAANWLPARLTLFLMAGAATLISPKRAGKGFRWALQDARKHPSPNSGWSEAFMAGFLGVQLGGNNYYRGQISHRAVMGPGSKKLEKSDIKPAVRILYGASLFGAAAGLMMVVWLGGR
ncbi:adenosylcobinamide-phosphate synthase CbiB [Alkalicoccus luteus]|uniref:Cobalamin biosynthesis protein CobD n=1 Tax=Alkalicoccus luteus TaxID=1237094 RepID=A0A969PVH7_9BACI|nr:adenosylcobinamide-phosphate synthase CbiB [Alkalicoccus luteus]NJP39136.1 cobalamin biosynthesis protein CobD [Alkalicoccus luteus]